MSSTMTSAVALACTAAGGHARKPGLGVPCGCVQGPGKPPWRINLSTRGGQGRGRQRQGASLPSARALAHRMPQQQRAPAAPAGQHAAGSTHGQAPLESPHPPCARSMHPPGASAAWASAAPATPLPAQRRRLLPRHAVPGLCAPRTRTPAPQRAARVESAPSGG